MRKNSGSKTLGDSRENSMSITTIMSRFTLRPTRRTLGLGRRATQGVRDLGAAMRAARRLSSALVFLCAPFSAAWGELRGQDAGFAQRPPYVDALFHRQFVFPRATPVGSLDPAAFDSKAAGGVVRLTLEDVVALTVRNSLGVQLTRYDIPYRASALRRAGAPFEPVWSNTAFVSRDTKPVPSIMQGLVSEEVEEAGWGTVVSKALDFGGALQADFSLRRYETSNIFVTVDPSVGANWTLGFTQHLLRGRGRAVNRAPTYVARNDLRVSQSEFRARLSQAVLDAEKLYWDVLSAETDLGVKRGSLKAAEQTRGDVEAQVAEGNLSELNLYKAKAEEARRRQDIIAVEAALKNLKKKLTTFLTPRAEAPSDGPEILLEPVDPRVAEGVAPEGQALQKALADRPEIASARAGLDSGELALAASKNRMKPLWDVSASYTQHGLRGVVGDLSALPFAVPPYMEDILRRELGGGAGGALADSLKGKYNGFRLQTSLVIPVGNVDAREAAAQAAIAVEKGRTALDLVRQSVALQVAVVYENLARDREMILAASETLVQAEKDLEGEQAKFDAGVVVLRDLLDAQRNLAQARSGLEAARYQLRKSHVDYWFATAQILERNGIRPEDAAR